MNKSMMNLMTCLTLTAVLSLAFVACVAQAQDKSTTSKPAAQKSTVQKPATSSTSTSSTVKPATSAEKSITETLKSLPECSQFVKCAEKYGVFKELEGKGPMTVLVPVNAAYDSMPADIRNEIRDSERKEKAVCRFHVLKGNLSVEALKTTENIETWCEDDGTCMMNFTEITKPSKDAIRKEIDCTNGRIYLINQVLIPECCKRGFLERAGETLGEGAGAVGEGVKSTTEWIGEGVKNAGEAVGEGAKDIYHGSRAVIGHGLESASQGLHKASDYVTPSQSPAPKTPKK